MNTYRYSFELLLHIICDNCDKPFTLSVENKTRLKYTCPNCSDKLISGTELPPLKKL